MFITDQETNIFATAFGPSDSPTIMAIGGWIGSWEVWAEVISGLSLHYRTITYDHRGSGITQAPLHTITLENLISDIYQVMDAFGVDHCVLAAESMGAGIALEAAIRKPDRFTGLVLANGIYRRTPVPHTDPFLNALRNSYPETLERFIQSCIPEADCEPVKDWGRKILGRAIPDAAIILYQLSGQIDLSDRLSLISIPTMVIHGELDSLVPVENAYWLKNQLHDADLVIIRGAGHVPVMTRPVEITQIIQNFLEVKVFNNGK